MLFKHTKPFDGCDEYMFEGQVRRYYLKRVFIIYVPIMLYNTYCIHLGPFTKDIRCDRHDVHSGDVIG